jgi:hypothetical protein
MEMKLSGMFDLSTAINISSYMMGMAEVEYWMRMG